MEDALACEIAAARLQLEEWQIEMQCNLDAQLALRTALGDGGGPGDASGTGGTAWDDTAMLDAQQALADQIASLAAFVAVYEGQFEEGADAAASRELAAHLDTQLRWDANLQAHDAALACELAACDADTWGESGDLIERPVDLSARPALPADPCGSAAGASTSGGQPPPVAPQAADRAARPAPPHDDEKGKGPAAASSAAGEPAAAAAAARRRQLRAVRNRGSGRVAECGICFDSFPTDGMEAAQLPEGAAASSASRGRCEHRYCTGCMRQYVHGRVQDGKYPLCCPSPSCSLELAHGDVMRLLHNAPGAIQRYEALMMEHSIDSSLRTYCPYKDCSQLLERPEADDGGGGAGQDDVPLAMCPLRCLRCAPCAVSV